MSSPEKGPVEAWHIVYAVMMEEAGDDNKTRVARNILHALRSAGFAVTTTAGMKQDEADKAALLDRLQVAEAVADAADLWTYCENNPDDAEDKLVAAVEQYRATRPEAPRDGR